MSKHTPGPWHTFLRTRSYNDSATVFSIAEESGIEVDLQHEANARLISAAPDMAEALKRLCHYANDVREDGEPPSHEDWRNAWEAAIAALKKAGIQ